MAETALLKEPLTSEMIDLGARLTEALDRAAFPIEASFWLFEEEANTWKLKIASPETAAKGSFVVYRMIGETMDALGLSNTDFDLWNVGLISSNNEIVRALRAEFKDGPYTTPKRLGRGAIRGRYIDDAYVYRA